MRILSPSMAKRLKQERIDRGWEQKKLATKLGITNVYMCYLERGTSQPSFELLVNWCRKLDFQVNLTIQPRGRALLHMLEAAAGG